MTSLSGIVAPMEPRFSEPMVVFFPELLLVLIWTQYRRHQECSGALLKPLLKAGCAETVLSPQQLER